MIDVKLPSRNGGKPLDALLVAKNDWANTGYRFWRCLQKLGLNALMVKGEPHTFLYPQQAPLHPSLFGTPIGRHPVVVMAPGLESLIESAHVVHTIGSTWPLVPFDWSEANLVNQHGGTTYRLDPDACNLTMDPYAKASIIQCPDLLNLGASNEHLIYYPVDTDFIKPDFEPRSKKQVVIGHFPSDPAVKGTAGILRVLKKLQNSPHGNRFRYLGVLNTSGPSHWKSWEQNLQRMSECDVIIETLAHENYGRPFGEWGNTCLEASALGKIVITNCLNLDTYEREYGDFAPYVANNEDELVEALIAVLSLSPYALRKKKKQHREWAVKNHSLDATALRLWERVYKEFF